MTLRIVSAVFVLVLLVIPMVTLAEPPVCPARVAGPNEPEELLMHESDFSFEKAEASVKFLRTDFSKRIWGPDSVRDLDACSGHYMGYMNSLRFIEGALLKAEVLRLRSQLQLVSIQKSDSAEAKAAAKAFEDAKAKFCNFIEDSIYVD